MLLLLRLRLRVVLGVLVDQLPRLTEAEASRGGSCNAGVLASVLDLDSSSFGFPGASSHLNGTAEWTVAAFFGVLGFEIALVTGFEAAETALASLPCTLAVPLTEEAFVWLLPKLKSPALAPIGTDFEVVTDDGLERDDFFDNAASSHLNGLVTNGSASPFGLVSLFKFSHRC